MSGYEIPFYARSGARISGDEWALLMGRDKPGPGHPAGPYRRIGLDRVGPIAVSTVWTGLDPHEMGSPQPYETVVMTPTGNRYRRTYGTDAEAVDGHAESVQMAQETWENVRAVHDFLGALGDILGRPEDGS